MTVWNVDKNAEAKTMVITAEFKASITTVWQLWADPRLLERWWGPPGFPATFEHHNLTRGGTITYSMSGPDGPDGGHRRGAVVVVAAGNNGNSVAQYPAADSVAGSLAVVFFRRE